MCICNIPQVALSPSRVAGRRGKPELLGPNYLFWSVTIAKYSETVNLSGHCAFIYLVCCVKTYRPFCTARKRDYYAHTV